MPKRNFGTLLENIVLVETTRLLTEDISEHSIVEFVNSFWIPEVRDFLEIDYVSL